MCSFPLLLLLFTSFYYDQHHIPHTLLLPSLCRASLRLPPLLLLLAALEPSASQNCQELRLLLQRETAAGRGAGVFVVGLGGGTLGGKQVAVVVVGEEDGGV